mgnify:CR=1 FL=1
MTYTKPFSSGYKKPDDDLYAHVRAFWPLALKKEDFYTNGTTNNTHLWNVPGTVIL